MVTTKSVTTMTLMMTVATIMIDDAHCGGDAADDNDDVSKFKHDGALRL